MESRASGRLSSESREWNSKSLLHRVKSVGSASALHLPQLLQSLNHPLDLFRAFSILAAEADGELFGGGGGVGG